MSVSFCIFSATPSAKDCTVQLYTEYTEAPTTVNGSCRVDTLTSTIDEEIKSIRRNTNAQAYCAGEPRDKLFAQNDDKKWKPLTTFAEIKENTTVLALAPLRGEPEEILNRNASFSSVCVCCFHVRVPQ
eukprot:GHVU01164686.1.p1 GENE.GHVU01164686.1~~GHVU01164686.1.p1  ORF type:complete len:129 (+),score=8.10 GHVU01164686.1:22-408(+)